MVDNTKPDGCRGCPHYEGDRIILPQVAPGGIMFVGGMPSSSDISVRTFNGSGGGIVRSMVTTALQGIPLTEKPAVTYAYAVQCRLETSGSKPNAKLIDHCNSQLMVAIARASPKVIVPVGAEALHALGYAGSLTAYRGGIYNKKFGDLPITVIPTFDPNRLRMSPGLTETFKKDIRKGVACTISRVDGLTFNLLCPRDFPGICEALDNMEAEIEAKLKANNYTRPIAVAIDTETTSLTPWLPESRMIALSFCWDEASNTGLAFPLDHKGAKNLTLRNKEHICKRIEQILQDPKRASIVMHNGKFDMKWVQHAYGINIADLAWDTLLGEHLIDEDKKGMYGLKVLTGDYFPGSGKYEEELQHHLEQISVRNKDRYKAQSKVYTEELAAATVPYWEDLGEDGRIAALGKWLDRGVIQAMDNKLISLDRKKATKKQEATGEVPGLYKRTETLILNLFKGLPPQEMPPEVTSQVGALTIDDAAKPATFEDIPLDVMLPYAAIDAVMTLKILKKQASRIQEEAAFIQNLQEKHIRRRLTNRKPLTWGFKNISLPLTKTLTEMEYYGVKLDREKIRRYKAYLEVKAEESKAKLMQQAGKIFNPQSGPDLIKILYEELKLPILKRSAKTQEPSTDAATLTDLFERYEHPILKELITFRKLEKCNSTYLGNWLDMSAKDGRLHTSFNVNGTATFRLSSSGPNLQNVMFYLKGVDDPDGKKDAKGNPLSLNLKSVFIPDSDEFDLYDLDIANAEMRMLCAYSRDTALIDAFNNGMDLHCLTAAAIGEYTYAEIVANKEDKSSPHYKLRQLAKAVNFGTIYCMGPSTLVRNLWDNNRIEISEEEAKEYLAAFFRNYPGVGAYISRTQRFVNLYHFTHTYTGRLRRFPILNFNKREGNRCGRQGVNARIQCSSAEVVNRNMVDVEENILKHHGGRMLLTVHDSMVFQLPKGMDGTLVKSMLDKELIQGVKDRFPWLPVVWKYDVDRGESYGDVHSF